MKVLEIAFMPKKEKKRGQVKLLPSLQRARSFFGHAGNCESCSSANS
ncbi:MAG: hypothetical protein QM426_12065 [Euryarchaeota archaeon]|nr:hypothetical protein [Euryarchaeota archaeon]